MCRLASIPKLGQKSYIRYTEKDPIVSLLDKTSCYLFFVFVFVFLSVYAVPLHSSYRRKVPPPTHHIGMTSFSFHILAIIIVRNVYLNVPLYQQYINVMGTCNVTN